jgi:hypothetical protein
MISRLFARWGDDTLQRELKRLRASLDDAHSEREALQRVIRVKDAEIDSLAAVVARDRERVKAETAHAARQSADGE